MNTMNDYTIYCTNEQTNKALELGAPIEFQEDASHDDGKSSINPTAEQMIGWLIEKGLFVDVTPDDYGTGQWASALCIKEEDGENTWNYDFDSHDSFDTHNKAVLAAIDQALDYL